MDISKIDRFTVYAPDAANDIIRFLFSYGFSGKSAVLATKTTAYIFLDEIQKIYPETIFVQGEKPLSREPIKGQSFVETRSKTEGSLKTTIDWIVYNKDLFERPNVVEEAKPQPVAKPKAVSNSSKKPKKKINLKNKKKWAAFSLLLLAILLLSPFLFLAVSLGALRLSFNSFLSGKTGSGEKLVAVSDAASSLSLGISNTFVQIPVLGTPYVFVSDASVLVKEVSVIGKRTAATLREVKVASLSRAFDVAWCGRSAGRGLTKRPPSPRSSKLSPRPCAR